MSNVIVFLAIHQEMLFVLYAVSTIILHINHVRSSTGIDAPLFSYFPDDFLVLSLDMLS